MPDNYYVEPLGGLKLGEAVGDAVTGGETRYRQMQIKKRMPEVLQSEDPDEMYKFVSEYPEAAEMVQTAVGFKDNQDLQAKVAAAKRIVVDGVDPAQVYEELMTEAEGPVHLTALGEALQDKNAAFERAKRILALNDPKSYESYLTMTPDVTAAKDDRTTLQKEYDTATSQGYTGTIIDYQQAIEGLKNAGGGTGEDQYVRDKETAYMAANPGTSAPQLAAKRADWRLEHKRAQAPEVAATTTAKELAELEFVESKKYLSERGKALAQIESNTALVHSKGELTEEEEKTQAKRKVTNELAQLGQYYTELDRAKGIVNAESSTTENILAALESSGFGQFVGKALGTKNQSLRNSIRSMKPLLLNDIRQSTDMGARGLDSEKELEFYLQAATDETRDIQSNIAAMIVLDEAYGDGQIAAELRKMNVAPEYIKEFQDAGKVIVNGALLDDVTRAKRLKAGRKPLAQQQPQLQAPQNQLPQGVTEEDIAFTMEKHGVTREQVLQRLGGTN